jgi:hypothetical protein
MNPRHLRIPLLIAVALALVLGPAACGGGGGSSEDPRQVVDETFSNATTIESGVFDLSFKVDAQGGSSAGNVDVELGGPFQGGGDGLPSFDVDAKVAASTPQGDVSFTGGLISTGDRAFVNFQDVSYQVPQQLFDQFVSTYTKLRAQSDSKSKSQNLLGSLGIEPTRWLTDLSNDGTEDVAGTETIHVSGSADAQKLLQDLQKVAQNAGPAAQQLSATQLKQAEDAIQSAHFDLYSGKDDKVLRKLTASLELKPQAGAGAPDKVTIDFSLTFSHLNEQQSVSAPSSSQPLSELLQRFGVDTSRLGGALKGGVGGLPQSGGSSTTAPSDSTTQRYLDCLQTARGSDEIQKCAQIIQ